MEIRIDEAMVQEAIDEQTTGAIKSALTGHKLQSAIGDMVEKALVPGVMAQAIESAISKIDLDSLSQSLADEIARSTTKVVQRVIQEALVGITLKIRGIAEFDHEKWNRARAELMAQF